MYCIGNVSPEKKKLVEVTKECVELGLKEVKAVGLPSEIWDRRCTTMHLQTVTR